jgi:tRNA threonylcarbamoyladenosine biosynthesis protein TsaB
MTSRVLPRAERLFAAAATGPVIGIDTAGTAVVLAVVARGRVLAEMSRASASHCAQLPAAVEELLGRAGVGFGDLEGVAVGLGPGSFTGLRVGLSYAKGISLALHCATVGVSTFDAMALAAWECADSVAEGAIICPVVDARKGEVYAALYRVAADGLEKVTEALVLPLEKLVHQISGEVIFGGDHKARDASELRAAAGRWSAVLEQTELDSRGRFVAALGAQRLSRTQADSPAALEPLYVRSAEATFKPPAASSRAAAKEGPWSLETKSSSSSI